MADLVLGATKVPALHADIGLTPNGVRPDVRRIGRRVSARSTCSQSFRDVLAATYPAAAAHPAFMRMLHALVSPRRLTEFDPDGMTDSRRVLLPGHLIADVMDRARDYAVGSLGEDTTGAFLTAFKYAVLPAFEWEDYVANRRVREVELAHLRSILDPAVLAAWKAEMSIPAHLATDRVYVDTGTKLTRYSQTRERDRMDVQREGYADEAHVDTAGLLYRTLDLTPVRTSAEVLRHLPAAYKVAETLSSEAARSQARRDLRDMADDPVQHYGFSPYTVRLVPQNAGVARIATPVRRALLPDSVELDLTGSQLATASVEFGDGCPMLYDFLDSGRSFWPEIVEWIGLEYDRQGHAKAAVKRPTYGTTFSMGRPKIVQTLIAEYASLTGIVIPHEQAARYLTHPLVEELLAARDAELRAIRASGSVVDAYGRTLTQGRMSFGCGPPQPVSGAKAAASLLAQRSQARELWILDPLVRLSAREATKARPEWRITCWQHDGCSIRFRRPDRRAGIIERLISAVGERAASANIPTRLEVKHDLPA